MAEKHSTDTTSSEKTTDDSPAIKVTPRELYFTYLLIALAGSGGLLFWTHRVIVEKKRWLTNTEFAEYYGLGQIIPGANLFNMALMLGHRYAGARGMLAVIGGFVSLSFFVMVGTGVFYQHYGSHPVVARALTGMAAVVIGLLFASSIKLAMAMPKTWRPWIFIGLGFGGVGALRWPLLWVAIPLAVISIWLAWRDDVAASSAKPTSGGA
ncbi:MAG: chromate transporter [Burkholderiales bacterium]